MTVRSLTHSVYNDLRRMLIEGRLQPGEQLKVAALCEALPANSSAVREALARLTAEGLVIAEPQRGYRVSPIAIDDLRQLTDARIEIEALCLRRAIELGDLAWETGIVAARHALDRIGQFDENGQPTDLGSRTHDDFHQAIVAGCDNRWLLQMREMLATQSERYRWLWARLSIRPRDLPSEHGALVEACLARDADLAVELMTQHLRRTSDDLTQQQDEVAHSIENASRPDTQSLLKSM